MEISFDAVAGTGGSLQPPVASRKRAVAEDSDGGLRSPLDGVSLKEPCNVAAPETRTALREILGCLDEEGVHVYRPRPWHVPLVMSPYTRLTPEEGVAYLEARATDPSRPMLHVAGPGEHPCPVSQLEDFQTLAALHLGIGAAGEPILAQTLRDLQRDGFRFLRHGCDRGDRWQRVDPLAVYNFATFTDHGSDTWSARVEWNGHALVETHNQELLERMAGLLHHAKPEGQEPVLQGLKTLLNAGFTIHWDESFTSECGRPDGVAHTLVVVSRPDSYFPISLAEAADASFVESRAAELAGFWKSHPGHHSLYSGEVPRFLDMCLHQWPECTTHEAAERLLKLMEGCEHLQDWRKEGDPTPFQEARSTLRFLESLWADSPRKGTDDLLDRAVHDWAEVSVCGKEQRWHPERQDFLGAMSLLYGDVRRQSRDLADFDRQRSAFLRLLATTQEPATATEAFRLIATQDDSDAVIGCIERAHASARDVVELLHGLERELPKDVPDVDMRAAVRMAAWEMLARGCKASDALSEVLLAAEPVGKETLDTRLTLMKDLADASAGDSFGPYMHYKAIVKCLKLRGSLDGVAEDYLLLLRGLGQEHRDSAWSLFPSLASEFRKRAPAGMDFRDVIARFLEAHLLTGETTRALEMTWASLAEKRESGKVETRDDAVILGGVRVGKRIVAADAADGIPLLKGI